MRSFSKHTHVVLMLCVALSLIAFAKSPEPPLQSRPEMGLHVTPVPLVQLVEATAPAAEAPPVAQPTPMVPGFNPDDPINSLITTGAKLAVSGNFLGLGLLVLFGVVWFFRKLVSRLPEGKFRDAMLSRWGGWGLNIGTSISGCFAALGIAGGPWNAITIVSAIIGGTVLSLAGAGGVTLAGDVKARNDNAVQAGATAAATVTTKKSAIDELTGS